MLKYKVAKKLSQQFLVKSDGFQKDQKGTKYLDHFCKKIFHQELSKIAQSGHTGCNNCTRHR